MTSAISFQGLSTNLQTDALVSAIMEQESQPLYRMEARKALNISKTTLLQTFSTRLTAISTALTNLNSSGFAAQTVSSSDSSGTYVTATSSEAVTGSYSVLVNQIALGAQLVVPQSVASKTDSLGGTADADGYYSYTVTGTSGTTTIQLSEANNTLAGLRDAIAASSSTTGVTASVVQTDSTGTQFKLVLSSTSTGLGTSGEKDITLAAGPSLGSNLLFTSASSYDTSTEVAAGSLGSRVAQDAIFSVNGVEMTRSSNTVTDAVSGITFALKSGGQNLATGTATTLTVAADKTAATEAMQAVVDAFNAALAIYKSNSTTDSSGNAGAFANDSSIRNLISQVRSAITGVPSDLSSGNYYQSSVELGISTNQDGTMSLDSTAFQSGMDTSPASVATLFNKIGTVAQDLISDVTSPGSGNVALIIQGIDFQNSFLTLQIESMQKRLDSRQAALEAIYANLEATVGQLQAAGQSLSSLA